MHLNSSFQGNPRQHAGVAIYPIVANYFFGAPYQHLQQQQQQQQLDAKQPAISKSYSSYRPKHPSKTQYKPYPAPSVTSYSSFASAAAAAPYTASSYEAFTQQRSNAHSN